MLTDHELELLFNDMKTPPEGRKIIRNIRKNGPVPRKKTFPPGARVRHVSKKMKRRAMYADSRTIAYPIIYQHEFNPTTIEMWADPYELDILDIDNGTRQQLIPRVFLISEADDNAFVMEDWRDEAYLLKAAAKRPEKFYRDEDSNWHFVPAEQRCEELGIKYRLHSTGELPRIFIANLHFLEDYTLETCPIVPDAERRRLVALMKEHSHLPMMDLLVEHRFDAGHINQLILDRSVFVDLYKIKISETFDLVIYRDQLTCQAHRLLAVDQNQIQLPEHAINLSPGVKFAFDGKTYEVLFVGETQVAAKDEQGATTTVPIELVAQLHQAELLVAQGPQLIKPEFDVDEVIKAGGLERAIKRYEHLNNPDMPGRSSRSIRRYKERTRGLKTPQEKLRALTSKHPGNTEPRLPAAAIRLAKQVVKEFHNTTPNPTISSSLDRYRTLCKAEGVRPMGRTSFYKWIRGVEDIAKREGKRKAYQKAAIPNHHDYEHPVHGLLPHDVCYIDHTTLNEFLKGRDIENLGKPTFTLATDGALSMSRALVVSYRPPCTESVLMVLRDYVRRHGRLPRTIVLDNAKEFHSAALKVFCSTYGITIRWRRPSKPRDSSLVERAMGATEVEVLQQLDGNSIALKNPREVSSSHNPEKHIKWSLAPLYRALEHYHFKVHAIRVHPRFGMSPLEMEKRMKFEMGDRSHVMVPYDSLLRLMTAPHADNKPTRVLDRQRGVYVDGVYYWHDKLALGKAGTECEVRREPWRRRVVYVRFKDEWLIAQARDGGKLEGRFSREVEIQKREESRRRKTDAQRDRNSTWHAQERSKIWDLTNWDDVLRAQMVEEYNLYSALDMCEALSAAKNPEGEQVYLRLPKVDSLDDVVDEPDVLPDHEVDGGLADLDSTEAALLKAVTTAPAKGRKQGGVFF